MEVDSEDFDPEKYSLTMRNVSFEGEEKDGRGADANHEG